jgi:hypothetical protein
MFNVTGAKGDISRHVGCNVAATPMEFRKKEKAIKGK